MEELTQEVTDMGETVHERDGESHRCNDDDEAGDKNNDAAEVQLKRG